MSWITIFKKEMKDSLSKKTILGLVLIVIICWITTITLVNVLPDSLGKDKANIGLIDLDESNVSVDAYEILSVDANIVYQQTTEVNHSIEEAIEFTKKNGGDALIIIEEGFGDNIFNNSLGTIKVYWIVETYGVIDMVTAGSVMLLLDDLKINMSRVLFPESSINYTTIMNSFEINETTILKGEAYENTSVTDAVGFVVILQVLLPTFIIVFMMFMGASIIESITKERRADMLETLLSFPVKRRDIIIGKILSCIVSMFITILVLQGGGSMALLSLSSFIPDSGKVGGIESGVTTFDYVMLMLVMLSGLLCAISLLTCSAMLTPTGAKSFIASLPSILLFTIPTVILMIYDFSSLSLMSKVILFVVPGSHVSIAINSVITNNYPMVVGSIIYLVLFSLLVFYIVIKLFKSDRVVA